MAAFLEPGNCVIKAGCRPQEAHRAWIKMNKCQSVKRTGVRFVVNLQWFRNRGAKIGSRIADEMADLLSINVELPPNEVIVMDK
jgi:uncharacterized protein (DUF1684 family)